MIDDVWPRRNLPTAAEEWGRQQEIRTDSNTSAIETLSLSTAGQNRSTASALEGIASQIQDIREAQEGLASAQSDINQTVSFLQGASQFASSSGVTSFVGTSSGTTWEAFNGTYDVSMSVTTGSSGRILVAPSARLVNVGSTCTPIVEVEVVGVTSLSWPNNPWSIYFAASGGASFSRQAQITLSPNTTYTVRTRRGRDGVGSGECSWGYQSLVVQKIL